MAEDKTTDGDEGVKKAKAAKKKSKKKTARKKSANGWLPNGSAKTAPNAAGPLRRHCDATPQVKRIICRVTGRRYCSRSVSDILRASVQP